MEKLSYAVDAKVNLSLNIMGLTEKNYHDLDMVVSSISLSDIVTISLRNDSQVFTKVGGKFGANIRSEKNIATVVAKAIIAKFACCGADIFIDKNIPICSGLGGSSCDAVGVILGYAKVLDLAPTRLLDTIDAVRMGSDIPCMLTRGYKYVKKQGESVQKIDSTFKINMLIVRGKKGVKTSECFMEFDRQNLSKKLLLSDNNALINSLNNCDISGVINEANNALSSSAIALESSVEESLNLLRASGAKASFMTGSGSACVGIFDDLAGATLAYEKLKNVCDFVEVVVTTF